MGVINRFNKILSERKKNGIYTERQYDIIYTSLYLIPEDKINNIEYLLNILDLFDELIKDEKDNDDVSDVDEKNKATLETYIKSGDIFSTPLLYHIKDENDKEVKLMKGSEVGTKGISKCRSCHMDNITFYSKQKSKADEGETLFLTCLDCGHKWQE